MLAFFIILIGCTTQTISENLLDEELELCHEKNYVSSNCPAYNFNYLKFDKTICGNKKLLKSFLGAEIDRDPDILLMMKHTPERFSEEKYYEYLKNECLKEYAIINNDPALCGNESRGTCELKCIVKLAVLNRDKSLCEKAGKDWCKKRCLLEIAVRERDVNACKELKSNEYCLKDLAIILKDPSLCDLLHAQKRDSCIFNIAATSNDKALCYTMKEEKRKDSCLFNLALQNKDSSICEEIKDPDVRSSCLSGIKRGNYNIRDKCGYFSTKYEMENCYNNWAKEANNPAICEKLVKKVQQELCKQKLKV